MAQGTRRSSAQRVLGIAELLEQILLTLPVRAIFGSARVCRSFHRTIIQSPRIRQKAFLTGRPSTTARELQDEAPDFNPHHPYRNRVHSSRSSFWHLELEYWYAWNVRFD